MILKLLETGYWRATWSPNLWLQWPAGRDATIEDGFGWITQSHVNEANARAAARSGK